VIGKPYSGKTKEAIELIKEIRGVLTILVPKGKGTISPFEVIPNEIKGDVILFLDDLPRYYVKPKEFQDSLEHAIEMLKKTCASVSMVATARSTELDKLYEYTSSSFWNNFEKIELEEFERIQTEQLLEVLCGQLNMTIDADAKDIIVAENDRTPKNPVIFFNWLKNNKIEHISAEIAKEFKLSVSDSWNAIYSSLSEIEKEVFQALDVLRYGSVIPHKVFVVDLITKQKSTFRPRRKGIEKAIETLIEKHLIEEQEKIIRCDDAYLEGKGDFETNIKTLVDVLLKRSKSQGIEVFILFSLMGLSDVLAEKKEFVDDNVKIIRKIIELNPELAVAHYNLGILLKEMGRKEDAEAEYREALRIDPDYAEAHYNLAILLGEMGRKEDAEAEYREALRINPDYAEAHNNLGNLLGDMGRKEDAEAECREALRINPDYAEAHGNLGLLFLKTGRKEEAKKELEIAKRFFDEQGREADAKKTEGLLKSLK
jgi:tetratricopeptide (TPR) repeat protein